MDKIKELGMRSELLKSFMRIVVLALVREIRGEYVVQAMTREVDMIIGIMKELEKV